MIKRITGILLILLITAGLGIGLYRYMTTPRQEGVCKLKTVPSLSYLYKYDIVNFYWTSEKNPDINTDSLSGIPKNISGRKIFFSIPFRDRTLDGCLFDHGQNGYTIYADLNDNGSLTDESPVVSHKQTYDDGDFLFLFGPLSLTDKTVLTAPFYLFLSNFTAGIHIGPTTIKKGKIKLNGHVHDLMLADMDFDGQYETHFSPECLKGEGIWNPALCDKLLFDLDRDKEFVDCYFLRRENLPLPKLIQLNNKYYSIKINDDILTASPTTPETGILKLNTHQSSIDLYSDTFSCLIDSANTVELPIGNYSVLYSQNQIKDSNGDIWSWRSSRSSEPAANFTITDNQITTVAFPTAFTMKTSVDYEDGKCGIRIRLFSDTNKEYAPIFQKNDNNPQEPTLTILDENNKEIHTGQMEYG